MKNGCVLVLVLAIALAGCGGNSPPSPSPIVIPPPPVWQALSYGIAGKLNAVLTNDAFDFPACTGNPLPCSVGYVEHGWGSIAGKASITLSYEITGDSPVFDWHTNPDNTCEPGLPPSLSLLIHRAGDNLSTPFFRYFSGVTKTLALGQDTLTVTLDPANWNNINDGKNANEAPIDFAAALANVASLGIIFGGGCFRSHGVAVTSGNARFHILSLTVQ